MFMTQHIVFLDRASLVATLRAPKFAHTWQDYDQTKPDEVVAGNPHHRVA